jgi:hypothetical protein
MLKKRFSTPLGVSFVLLGVVVFPQLVLQARSAGVPSRAPAAQPDLIVDQASLRQHWVVRVEDFPAEFCSVQEGGLTPAHTQSCGSLCPHQTSATRT